MSLTSEELDKQVAEFLAKGGSIQEVKENKFSKPKRMLCSFLQGEYDQVINFIKLSPTPVMFTDIVLYLDYPKSKVRAILACAEGKGKLKYEICPHQKVKLWSAVR
ncbi:hypothetical protein [Acinetobacter baumannii]|uniref:hypothetical protein n=1 Tax=Acinetobacter baumannii TaxID=470 RepID=UPI003AF938F8